MSKVMLPLSNRFFKRNDFIKLVPFLILLGKLVRFTLMKTILVDTSIGWEYLPRILNDPWYFVLGLTESSLQNNAADNSIVIYKILNLVLNTDSFYVFETAITIIFNLVLVWLLNKIERRIDFYSGIFLMLFIAVLNLFDFTLSKEPIQMLYFIGIFLLLIRKKMNIHWKLLGATAILILCVLTFRIYYIFIIYFMFVTFLILQWIKSAHIKNKYVMIFLIMTIVAFSFVAMMIAIKKIAPSEYSYLLLLRTKANRVGSASQINVLFSASSSSILIYVFDLMIMVIRMLFPFELFILGPKYIPYILFQLFITIYYIRALINSSRRKISIQQISLCIYTGFVVGSSTFEPDFGSWVRHEAVLFPIIILMCGLVNTHNICYSIRKTHNV